MHDACVFRVMKPEIGNQREVTLNKDIPNTKKIKPDKLS